MSSTPSPWPLACASLLLAVPAGAQETVLTYDIVVSHGGETLDLDWWSVGYNDLSGVCFNDPDSEGWFRISLHADAGWQVGLKGFDVGNYGAAITLPGVRVFDEHGLVFEETNVPLEAGNSPNERSYSFGVPLTGQVLVLEIETTGLGSQSDNVGIDNVHFRQDPGPALGTPYCGPAVPNSAGEPGMLIAVGSDLAADNDLTLVASGLPRRQFGYFLASQSQGFVANPGGSQGNLCLGGSITRFAADVAYTGPEALLVLPVDLTDTPGPGEEILAGESWSFSCWFRDADPNPTSNFTDAVTIAFL